jgi:diaminopimelate decarboxylase
LEDAIKLTNRFGYPLYVYEEQEITRRIRLLKYIFDGFDIFYSLKANPNKKIVSFMARNGLGADCASPYEVLLANECGISSCDILYSSPGKTEEDMEIAIDKSLIVADSLGELERMDLYFNKRTNIGVRINPSKGFGREKAFEIMGGGSSKFGIDEELFFHEISNIEKLKNINIIGIHVYIGSGILDEEVILGNFENIFRIASRSEKKFDFIDFGGGLGIPYEEGQKELDAEILKKGIQKIKDAYKTDKTRLIVESGRYLTATCGRFLTRITDIKESAGKKYYIIYGGMNGFFRPAFTGTKHKVKVHNHSEKKEKVTVAGHLCTPIDITASEVQVSKGSAGDVIEICDAGAYGYTMSLKEFISHRQPVEIYIDQKGNAEKC